MAQQVGGCEGGFKGAGGEEIVVLPLRPGIEPLSLRERVPTGG
jgi:hypothetical protein